MTTPMTPLDLAYEAMVAAPEGEDAPRLRFYERLADGEMILLLETEAEGETLTPRVFDLEDGPVVLIFDTEAPAAPQPPGMDPAKPPRLR